MVRIVLVGLIAAALAACDGESGSEAGVAPFDASGAAESEDISIDTDDTTSDGVTETPDAASPHTTESSDDIGVGPDDGSAAEHDAAPVTSTPLPVRPDRFPIDRYGDVECNPDSFCLYSAASSELAIVFIESDELILEPRITPYEPRPGTPDICYSAHAAMKMKVSVLVSTSEALERQTIDLYIDANAVGAMGCQATLLGYEPQEPSLNCWQQENPLFLGASALVGIQPGAAPGEWWLISAPPFAFADPTTGAVDIYQSFCMEDWPAGLTSWERIVEERVNCTERYDQEWRDEVRLDIRRSVFDTGLYAAARCVGPAPDVQPEP